GLPRGERGCSRRAGQCRSSQIQDHSARPWRARGPRNLRHPLLSRPVARAASLIALAAGLAGTGVNAREIVDSSPPQDLAVTIYRDPGRGPMGAMNRDWPQGFAMISETRTVTLPPGESTIRF